MSLSVVFRNTGFMFTSQLISRIAFFGLIFAIARILGDEGLGIYSFVFAFVGLFSVLNDLGLSVLLMRDVARNKANAAKYFTNGATIKLVIGSVASLLAIVSISVIESNPTVRLAVYLAAGAIFFQGMKDYALFLFGAFERMYFIAVVNTVEVILAASLSVAAMLAGYGIVGITAVFLAVYFLMFLLALTGVKKQNLSNISVSFDITVWKQLLKASLPFWLTGVFIAIYFRIDTVMIGMMRGYVETGLYNAAYRLLDALYFIPSAIIAAVFPAMSRLHVSARETLTTLYRKAFSYLLIIALPMGVGTLLLAERILTVIYSNQFSDNLAGSALALQILIWAEVAIFLSALTGYLLNAIDKQKTFTITAGAAAILNVILNFFFIPRYGFIGAAMTTVITEFAVLIILYLFASKAGHAVNPMKALARPVFGCIVMAPVILLLSHLHVLLIIPAAAVVYAAVILGTGGIEKEERDMVLRFLRMKA